MLTALVLCACVSRFGDRQGVPIPLKEEVKFRVAMYYYDDPTAPHAAHVVPVLRQHRRVNPTGTIFFVTSHATWTAAIHDLIVVRTHTLPKLPVAVASTFPKSYQTPLHAFFRFWFMYHVMLRFNLQNMVQIESDQWLYINLHQYLPLSSAPLWVTPLTANKATASFFFAKTASAMKQFIEYMLLWCSKSHQWRLMQAGNDPFERPKYHLEYEADSEMSTLWAFHRNRPHVMQMLPTIPPALGWPCVFDPGSYGQWHDNLRDLHHHTAQRPLISGKYHMSGTCVNNRPLCNIHAFGKIRQIQHLPLSVTCHN